MKNKTIIPKEANSKKENPENANIPEKEKQYRLYRTDDLAHESFNKPNYNKFKSFRDENNIIMSYIFGIIPKLKENSKGIIYPYRIMIKQDQYLDINS